MRRKKRYGLVLVWTFVLVFVISFGVYIFSEENKSTNNENVENNIPNENIEENKKDAVEEVFLKVPSEYSKVDKNNNGIPDPIDLSNNAKKQFKSGTKYVDAYYTGGYPPEDEGVCTDVIWRAFKDIDVNLKDLIDKDIEQNKSDYWRIDGKQDKNIDFRRVPNQLVFFQKYATKLSSEIIPGDAENLKEWQPGDIIIFLKPYQHVGIVTDERDSDGVPYVVHNNRPQIQRGRLNWFSEYEIEHYRWKY